MIGIRSFTQEDAKAIVRFNENTGEDFFNQWGGGKYYTYPLTEEQIINRIQNTENARCFAIYSDDTVIGMVELDFIDWEQKICSVCRFVIGAEFRGKGYGVHTLNLLCGYASSELDMRKVKLSVFDFNTHAYKCYIKAGFRVVGEAVRPNGWKAIQMEYTPLTFRAATIDDTDLFSAARLDFFISMNVELTDEQKEEVYRNNREYFIKNIKSGTFTAFLAFDAETLAGTSGITFYTTPPHLRNPMGENAYISNMFTKPEYRGRGIATKLFAMTVDEAKRRGCRRITLHATDMGRPLYEKFGFVVPHNIMSYDL